MILDKAILGKKAKELGFPRDTLEKVYHLAEILKFMGDVWEDEGWIKPLIKNR